MKNPFFEFKDFRPKKREIPLDKIIASKEKVMDALIKAYDRLVEQEAKELVWLVSYHSVIRAYANAEKSIKDMQYGVEDIEEFLFEMENPSRLPYPIMGLCGLYISALCNHIKEKEIVLDLQNRNINLHLLGYRLPKGKRLIVYGDLGDFTGIGLNGGELLVEGNAGNWTGAGMRMGKIVVKKNVGRRTGEDMVGGEIYVEGKILGVGNVRYGRIYEKGGIISP